ncbi:MAG: methylated-DNA--[protein]-cysteine S-methyltransferase [Tannerella sp.]|jgi:methylated-DNA-[protein]-cysteine S-methyltransferase|nr:methylated-DNA--[protein]-cysteine S-methyltransferase [Tannerella sp.]
MVIKIQSFETSCGELLLGSFNEKLCLCDWKYRKRRIAIDSRIQKALNAVYEEGDSELIEQTREQLNQYFSKERTVFDLPLLLAGTDFQREVWEELMQVPYGMTESYSGLANRLNKPKAVRAVATANGANAISIIIPCHRIIGSNNKLVGYAGGLDAKKKLLALEQK